MKRKIAAILCAVMLLGLLAACGGSPADKPAQEPNTEQTPEPAPASPEQTGTEEKPSGSIVWLSNSAYGDVPQSLADAYMDYNPNAEIVLESYSRTELMKVIDIKMGAGDDTYDVFFVDQPLIASYYWKDYLQPLNEYFTQDDLDLFTSADLNAGYVEGDLEALPLTSSSQVLMVNLDLLREAGLTLDEGYLTLEKRLT